MDDSGVHIGMSGWSYPEWKDIFYPDSLPVSKYLEYYCGIFNTTEINGSFYNLPTKQTVEQWVQQVPPDFVFSPKMNRYLTHVKRLSEPQEPLERFFNVFEPMYRQLGVVLLQLPPTLQFNEGTVVTLFELFKDQYSQFRFALEPRHTSWVTDEVKRLFRHFGVTWVISQSGADFAYQEWLTSDEVYFRFHGPGKLYASCYTDEELMTYAEKIKLWSKKGYRIWAYFNNTMDGIALRNGRTIIQQIAEI